MVSVSMEKPCIKVLVEPSHISLEAIKQITFGIEEEGIPFEVESGEGDSRKLAYEGSMQSRLGVCVGVADETVTLGYEKLPEDEPLFEIPLESDRNELRRIGVNAARLVKKMPFIM